MPNALRGLGLAQFLFWPIASAAEPSVHFGGYNWRSIGDNVVEVATREGQETLLIDQRDADGLVVLEDEVFTAGEIEFDVVAIDRAPPELVFALDEQTVEHDSIIMSFWPYYGEAPYRRLKQLTLTPGDRNQLVCLIHRGETDTSPEHLQWIHVSIKIDDDLLAITVGEDEQPCIVIGNPFDHCRGDRFGLRGSGYFRNIELRPVPDA